MKDISQKCEDMIKYEGYFLTLMEVNQYETHKYAFIVMERAEMNLEQLIVQKKSQGKRFTEGQLEKAIHFLVGAFLKLTEMNIAHCDIKPENILILNSNNLQMKLCDVGSCKVVSMQNAEEATILGTVPFLAPELINVHSKSSSKIVSANPFKSDVYSFGLVVLYMITYKKFLSQERVDIDEGTYHEIINEWTKEAKELGAGEISAGEVLKMALEFDEHKRQNFKELYLFFVGEMKKRRGQSEKEIIILEEIQNKISLEKMGSSKNLENSSTPGLQKSRGLRKTIGKNGFGIGLKERPRENMSPSPTSKRKKTSVSPSNSFFSAMSTVSAIDFKRIIYVS